MNKKKERIQKQPDSENKNKPCANVWEIITALSNFALACFTLILVIIGGITAYLLFGQFDILKKQLLEMQSEARVDQRAWVIPSKIDAPNETSNKWFKVTFKNTGKTPALEMSGWTVADSQFNWEEGDKKPFALKCLIAPDGIISNDPFDSSTVCPIGSASKVSRGEKTVFFFGKVWYKDIFGGNHWTEFSYRFSKIVDADGYILQPWGYHNRTYDTQTQNKFRE